MLDTTRYSLTQIKSGEFDPHPALLFCRDWLNGKPEFKLQTSGSTGLPKELLVHRDQLQASAHLTNSYLGLTANSTSLVCLDTRYIAGIMMLVRSLEAGMNIRIAEPAANPFTKIPQSESVDFTALVPYQVDAILNSSDRDRFNQIHSVLIGGATLNQSLKKELQPFKAAIFATYGMTETLSHIALQRISGPQASDFFQVLPGISISLDARGCLVIHAPHIQEADIVTNDLVNLIAPGQFTWLGRIDTVINSAGIKIIPETIEALLDPLLKDAGIDNRFFIGGTPDPKLGEVVTLVVEGQLKNADELLQHMKVKLPRHQAPRLLLTISHFVETETGKINRGKTIELLKGEVKTPTRSS